MSETIETLRRRYPDAVTFTLGDTPELSAWLASLIRGGKKVATCGALRHYQNGAALPSPGRRDIILDWDGNPEFVIETLEVIHTRFCDITEEMALAEGESDDLEGWRDGHREYYGRTVGYDFDMEVVWERFALVEDLQKPA
jgi:uncharacterized protein YhfF